MDFVHDQLIDGRSFRMLTVIDQFSRLSPLVEPGVSFSGHDVAAALDRIVLCAGTPMSITVGHIESCNGRQRDECLNVTQFLSIDDARERIERWRIDCNAHRPHSSTGNLTPSEFAKQRQVNGTSAMAKI